jgi:hypothetical protein
MRNLFVRASAAAFSALLLASCAHHGGTLPSVQNSNNTKHAPIRTQAYSACSGGYVGTVLCDGPTQFFQMNETSGTTVYDSATTPHNGTYTGPVTLGASPAPVYGDTSAVSMPGSNGTLADVGASLPNPALASGTSWTMETWIYPVLPASNGWTLYQTVWGFSGLSRLLYGQSKQLLLQLGGGANCFSTSTIPTQTWTMVDVVYNAAAAQATLFINGTQDATCSFTNAQATLNTAYYVGEYSSTAVSYKWSGLIGEHSVYSSALSGSRISAHYSASRSAAPSSARPWTLIHVYEGNATNGGGGYDPGPSEDQAVLFENQGAGFDPGAQDYLNNGTAGSSPDCPLGASCIPVGYATPIIGECDDSVAISVYNHTDASDEAGFTHNSSSIVPTNRLVDPNYGRCPQYGQWTSGGANQTYGQYYNYHDMSANSPYVYWKTEWPSVASNDSWKETMVDNFTYFLPYTTNRPYEYTSVSDWRATITKWLMTLNYPVISNSLGPGGGWYDTNDRCATSFSQVPTCANNGVVGYAVDTNDICNNVGTGKLVSLISEDPFAYINSSGALVYLPNNLSILANSVSHVWANSGCNRTNVEMLEYTSDEVTYNTNVNLRAYYKAATMILEPSDYDGQVGSRGVVTWQYSTCILCSNQLAIFPEDELVFVPDADDPLDSFTWGGTSDGNGCQAGASADSNGLVPFAQDCGVSGQVDGGGYYSPVLVREGNCYVRGSNIGQCAAVIDTCYNGTNGNGNCPVISVASLKTMYTYDHALSLSGAELTTDPNTGATLSPSANIPNGQSPGSMSITGSIPATITGCGSSFQSTCALILTK